MLEHGRDEISVTFVWATSLVIKLEGKVILFNSREKFSMGKYVTKISKTVVLCMS